MEYSIDRSGATLVFAVDETDETTTTRLTPTDTARGYRITFQGDNVPHYHSAALFLTTRLASGEWTTPKQMSFESPFTNRQMSVVPYLINCRLSLSPNGKRVALSYVVGGVEVTDEWKRSALVRNILSISDILVITVLVDLTSGRTTM